MTDELTSLLGSIGVFDKVTSRRSAMRFKGSVQTAGEIAGDLGVDALVEGSIFFSSERVRVTVALIDAGRDNQLWSDSYDEPLVDILDLQRRIVREIAGAISRNLDPEVSVRMAARSPVDPRAYRAYLRGLDWLNTSNDDEGWQFIETCFLESIAADSTFAPAWAGLAEVHVRRTHSKSGIPPADAIPAARKYLARAMELDDSSAEAYLTQGHLAWEHEFDFARGEAALRKSISLNPNLSYTRLIYAYLLTCSGRHQEAADQVEKAWELDPLARLNWVGVYPLVNAGRFETALRLIDHVAEQFPDWQEAVYLKASTLQWQGRIDEAAEFLESHPDRQMSVGESCLLARLLYLQGRRERARAILADLEPVVDDPFEFTAVGLAALATGEREAARRWAGRLDRSAVDLPWQSMLLHAALGDLDRAFAQLDRCYELRVNWITRLGFIVERKDNDWNAFRSDPRYAAFLAKMGIAG